MPAANATPSTRKGLGPPLRPASPAAGLHEAAAGREVRRRRALDARLDQARLQPAQELGVVGERLGQHGHEAAVRRGLGRRTSADGRPPGRRAGRPCSFFFPGGVSPVTIAQSSRGRLAGDQGRERQDRGPENPAQHGGDDTAPRVRTNLPGLSRPRPAARIRPGARPRRPRSRGERPRCRSAATSSAGTYFGFAKQAARDGQAVEDVDGLVAEHLLDLARAPRRRPSRPSSRLQDEPGDGVGDAHTAFPSTYQTGPWVATGSVSESTRRMRQLAPDPLGVQPLEAAPDHRRRGAVAEAPGDAEAEAGLAAVARGIHRRQQQRGPLEKVGGGQLELGVQVAPVGRQRGKRLVPGLRRGAGARPRARPARAGRTRRARARRGCPRGRAGAAGARPRRGRARTAPGGVEADLVAAAAGHQRRQQRGRAAPPARAPTTRSSRRASLQSSGSSRTICRHSSASLTRGRLSVR